MQTQIQVILTGYSKLTNYEDAVYSIKLISRPIAGDIIEVEKFEYVVERVYLYADHIKCIVKSVCGTGFNGWRIEKRKGE